MTKKFVRGLYLDDLEPEELKECLDGYYEDRKEAFDCLKIGSILEHDLCHYGDLDQFQITKINERTREITVEFIGGVPGI